MSRKTRTHVFASLFAGALLLTTLAAPASAAHRPVTADGAGALVGTIQWVTDLVVSWVVDPVSIAEEAGHVADPDGEPNAENVTSAVPATSKEVRPGAPAEDFRRPPRR